MNRVEAISKAIDLLKERGWCRNTYENGAGQLCLLGAVNTAIYGSACVLKAGSVGLPDYYDTVREDVLDNYIRPNIVDPTLRMNLHTWNDFPWRTKEEVLELFESAKTLLSI